MLRIKNLHVQVEQHQILKGVELQLKAGEVHAIMGPNGSGKSTLASTIAGHPDFTVTDGQIEFEGKNIAEWSVEERALEGIFLAFQYPVEIAGVNNAYFLKAAYNAQRKHKGLAEIDAIDFLELLRAKLKDLGLDDKYLNRSVNEGFSGGEKKRNEMLQLALLEPKLAILDETDSGLDIDALRTVAQGVNKLRSKDRSILLVTHYQRLLDYIEPDFVHVMLKGKIVQSGDKTLAHQLEKEGYQEVIARAKL